MATKLENYNCIKFQLKSVVMCCNWIIL